MLWVRRRRGLRWWVWRGGDLRLLASFSSLPPILTDWTIVVLLMCVFVCLFLFFTFHIWGCGVVHTMYIFLSRLLLLLLMTFLCYGFFYSISGESLLRIQYICTLYSMFSLLPWLDCILQDGNLSLHIYSFRHAS